MLGTLQIGGRLPHRASRMTSSYLRQVAVAASSNLVGQVLGTGTGLLLARTLEPAGRGGYAAVTAWTGTIGLFAGLGIGSAICYFTARSGNGAAAVSTSLRLLVPLSVAASVVGFCLTPLLAPDDDSLRAAYLVGFGALPITIVGGIWVFALQGRDIHRWSRVRLVQPAVFAGLIVLLHAFGALTLLSAIVAIALSTVIGTGSAVWEWGRVRGAREPASRALRRPLLSYGLKSLASQAPYLINSRVDQLILSLIVPLEELGLYAVAVSLTMLVFPITSAFGSVVMPALARRAKDAAGAKRTMRQAVIGSSVAGIIGAVLVVIMAATVVPAVIGQEYADMLPLVLVLAPGAVFLGLNQVLSDALRGFDRALLVARAEGFAAVITLMLLGALVPSLGAMGAAISSTASYILASGLLLRAAHRQTVERDSSEGQPPPPEVGITASVQT